MPELAWLDSAADPVEELTTRPVACTPSDPDTAGSIRAGELAFASPVLLGGQAAKIGLSCASCHRNGRGNRHFFISAVSDGPGRADVTSGVFGRSRADNVFNPVSIPDLATPDGTDQVDRHNRPALETFVMGQIVEEFSGPVPAPTIMSHLSAYLSAIDPSACSDSVSIEPIIWRDDWQAALDAASLARSYALEGDAEAARFYRETARRRLGRLAARYDGPTHSILRDELKELSRQLSAGTPLDNGNLARLEAGLEAAAPFSLYDADTLRRRLQLGR